MKVVVALAASVALFSVLVVATGQAGPGGQLEGTRLRAPADGEARPELLDDGSPVFVVAHRDGSVGVLSAINPHLDRLVVWCERSRVFTEVGPASRFDEYGRYLGGPARQGLTPFAAEIVAGEGGVALVEVGERLEAPGRDVPAVQPSGPDCGASLHGNGLREVFNDPVGHDLEALYGPRQAPEDATTSDGLYRRFDARVAVADGQVVVCSPRHEDGCPDGSRRLVSYFHDFPYPPVDAERCVGHVDGELLARPTRSGFADAALFPYFTEVGVATAGGYDDQLRCEPIEAVRPVAEVAGELVAVEQDADGTWTAVLAEPVTPSLRRGMGRTGDVDERSRDRFPFSDGVVVDVGVDTMDDPPAAGEPRPQGWYTPAQLPALLDDVDGMPVLLDLRSDGRIVSGYADPWDR